MQKKVPYVAQLGNMDCSIACMTMLFRYYGLDVDIVDVGQVVHIGRDGVNCSSNSSNSCWIIIRPPYFLLRIKK